MQESNLVRNPVKFFFLKTEVEKIVREEFMSIDVQIKKSNVTIVFFFLSKGYRCGLAIEEMNKKINVVFNSKEHECVIYIPFVNQRFECRRSCFKPLLYLDGKECIA